MSMWRHHGKQGLCKLSHAALVLILVLHLWLHLWLLRENCKHQDLAITIRPGQLTTIAVHCCLALSDRTLKAYCLANITANITTLTEPLLTITHCKQQNNLEQWGRGRALQVTVKCAHSQQLRCRSKTEDMEKMWQLWCFTFADFFGLDLDKFVLNEACRYQTLICAAGEFLLTLPRQIF